MFDVAMRVEVFLGCAYCMWGCHHALTSGTLYVWGMLKVEVQRTTFISRVHRRLMYRNRIEDHAAPFNHIVQRHSLSSPRRHTWPLRWCPACIDNAADLWEHVRHPEASGGRGLSWLRSSLHVQSGNEIWHLSPAKSESNTIMLHGYM